MGSVGLLYVEAVWVIDVLMLLGGLPGNSAAILNFPVGRWVWAVLWFLFFLLLGLTKSEPTRMKRWFTVFISQLTATIPAHLLGRKSMRSSAEPGQAASVAPAA